MCSLWGTDTAVPAETRSVTVPESAEMPGRQLPKLKPQQQRIQNRFATLPALGVNSWFAWTFPVGTGSPGSAPGRPGQPATPPGVPGYIAERPEDRLAQLPRLRSLHTGKPRSRGVLEVAQRRAQVFFLGHEHSYCLVVWERLPDHQRTGAPWDTALVAAVTPGRTRPPHRESSVHIC